MRYGEPSIPRQLKALMDKGCERIVLAPLYPQYSGATTATVMDKAGRCAEGDALAGEPARDAAIP
jgi:protoporphyrin/coproporphyrin ferrochelatase